MSEAFTGEIRMFAGGFAPRGWALCDGQLLAVSSNDALFSLFGTMYGGDGRTTFGLPDLRGRIPVHVSQGPGLTNRPQGQKSGQENVTLVVGELPTHTHRMQAATSSADNTQPADKLMANAANDVYIEDSPDQSLASNAISSVGSSNAHENMAPFLGIYYIVALFGVYPSRS